VRPRTIRMNSSHQASWRILQRKGPRVRDSAPLFQVICQMRSASNTRFKKSCLVIIPKHVLKTLFEDPIEPAAETSDVLGSHSLDPCGQPGAIRRRRGSAFVARQSLDSEGTCPCTLQTKLLTSESSTDSALLRSG
jgi:hypothetical protein